MSSEPPTAGTDATLAAAGARLATALLSRPVRLARHTAGLLGELVRIGLGSSTLAPDPADPRFAAAAWARDPVLRRAVQTHLATTGAADALLADAGLADADDAVLRGLVATLADLASPSSNPVLRALASGRADAPADTPDVAPGETSVVLAAVPPAARPTAPRRLVVGEEVAATPGAVVLRTPSFELLHYLPQTREVRDVPVLVVPAPTAASYLADLSPPQPRRVPRPGWPAGAGDELGGPGRPRGRRARRPARPARPGRPGRPRRLRAHQPDPGHRVVGRRRRGHPRGRHARPSRDARARRPGGLCRLGRGRRTAARRGGP
ncbi:hypothetical protein ACFQV8_20755 [Pseudonocardia benzenivorans]